MSDKSYFILISAGGTGGHMSPAAALAHDLIGRGFRVELATDDRGMKHVPMFGDIETHIVKSGTTGADIKAKLKGALNLGLGMVQGFQLVNSLKPDLVIGFGGYPSFPAVYAAQKLKIPTILQEQNTIVGKANAMLAPGAERIALSLPGTVGLDKDDQMRSVITGAPIRSEIAALHAREYAAPSADEPLNILIMGGSLGATVFSEIVPATLSGLPKDYRERLRITQQCRAADIDEVRTEYKKAGIRAELSTFIDDVAGVLGRAHLVIARSGASTVAEVSVAGVPAIYVPYPHHADQQQKKNANVIADRGGAWVMTEDGFTQDALKTRIETFFQNPAALDRAAEAAKACGKPDAAKKLGNLVKAIVQHV